MNKKLLAIYLNDHLAGAALGFDLAKRSLKQNAGTEFEPLLEEIAAEIEEDRQTLVRTMALLAIPHSRLKVAVAWAAEKVARLKLNGQLHGYSPLSRLLELEGLKIGIDGKRALWLALGQLKDEQLGDVDFERLAARASSQRDRLEPFRLAAARDAFASKAPESQTG
jgi:hypothetical protein